MRVVIGSDHAGWILKQTVMEQVRALGHEVTDVGSHDDKPVDFPVIARELTGKLKAGEAERGIMVCGTGVGASIAANKVKGIRAAVCHDVHSAHQSVEHDDVNVMCIGAQIIGPWLAKDLVASYLQAEFSTDEDCRRRVEMLHAMDAEG
ncbi:ribose-5-phosphate isomerase [Alsobacter metallidurans]|uniref:Ribose-5-phosphate isomerase n=1 Tax=Alsobacter metallidurans TaxID=340221 RepID=A0A917I8G9_9HYPH|nr:ribose 5-phosphate isomerase B [Alsobacter metallidurans]GGH22847.1 ribose-5-phosphate isomerase [Alsobacter metallidurans]